MKEALKKINYISVVNIILCLLMLPPLFYAIVGSYAFGAEPMKALPSAFVIALASVGFVVFIILICFNIFNNEYRPNYIIATIFFVLFIINAITIFYFKSPQILTVKTTEETITQIYYTLDIATKLKFIAQFAVVLMVMFLIADVFPKIFKGVDLLYLLTFFTIIFAIYLTVYSLMNETEFYTNYIQNLFIQDGTGYHAKAIFPNKNSYSIVLFAGMMGSLFLHNRSHKFYWFIPATYLFLFIMISFCKTLIIVAPLFYGFYLLFRFFLSFKEHKIRNLITLGVFIVAFAVLFLFMHQLNVIHPGIIKKLYVVIFKNSESYSSIDSRENIWISSYYLISHFNIFFGVGFNVYGDILFEFMFSETTDAWQHLYAHNTIIEILGDGGLIFLSAYLFLLGFIIYASIKIFKKYKTLSMFALISIVAMLSISLVESGSFIFPYSLDYAFFSAVIFVPVLNKYYYEKKLTKLNLAGSTL